MSIIPLLLLFVIWKIWSPEQAVRPIFSVANGLSIFVIGYSAMLLVMGMWSRWLSQRVELESIGKSLRWFNRVMEVARFFIPAWFAVGVFLLGWGRVVDQTLMPIASWRLELPSALVGLSPGIFAWMALWWAQFPADRALREQNLLTRIENDLPVFTSSSFRAYFGNKLRIQLLFTIIPVLSILAMRDLAILAMTTYFKLRHQPVAISEETESVIWLACAASVFLFAPEVLRRVLRTRRLPDSPLRSRLEKMCQSANMKCREILLWQTHNNTGNAAVMGIVPRVRYVMLSDLLLETMTDEQVEAVFAHELGHVKHRHIVWYMVFFIAVATGVYAAGEMADHFLKIPDQYLQIGATIIFTSVFWTGYAFLSRRFERQADVHAARTMEQIENAEATGVGKNGARVFASALERIAVVNNIPITAPSWTHGSIANRMRYIRKLGREPLLTFQFDRSIRLVYMTMIAMLITCTACAVQVARSEWATASAPPSPVHAAPRLPGAAGPLPLVAD